MLIKTEFFFEVKLQVSILGVNVYKKFYKIKNQFQFQKSLPESFARRGETINMLKSIS